MTILKYIISIPFRLFVCIVAIILGIVIVPFGITNWAIGNESATYPVSGRYAIKDWLHCIKTPWTDFEGW